MSAHTPGPWRADFAFGACDVITGPDSDDAVVIASCTPGYRAANLSDRQRADAVLVAAAPDLLTALRDMVALSYDNHGECFRFEPEHCRVCTARAAIAKATGEAP